MKQSAICSSVVKDEEMHKEDNNFVPHHQEKESSRELEQKLNWQTQAISRHCCPDSGLACCHA